MVGTVLPLGTKYKPTPSKLYASKPEHIEKIKAEHTEGRLSAGLSAAEEF